MTEALGAIGVEVPPEVQMGALVALAAVNASNPVGWVALAAQVVFQFASMKSWTEVTDIAPGIDADGDGAFDDTGQLSTDYHTTFWGRRETDDGRLQYEVVSPNGLLLKEATFDLTLGSEREVSFVAAHEDVDGTGENREKTDVPHTLYVDGQAMTGELTVPEDMSRAPAGDSVVAQFTPDPDDRAVLEAEGTLVPGSGTIPIHVTVERQGRAFIGRTASARETAAAQFSYEVDSGWRATALAPGLRITGSYDGINPATVGEAFSHAMNLTPTEFAAISAELGGGAEPVTLAGDDPLLQLAGDDPATAANEAAPSALLTVMEGVVVTFEGAERDPNLYQYMDVTGDGNPDLVRYGISADDDGLASGDERYEVTLLGPDLTDMGLPTIRHPSLDTAADIAQLTPYLLAWGASRPDLAQHGHDPVSLFNLATERGDVDALIELRDLDRALASDMAIAGGLLASEEPVTDARWADAQAAMRTSETTQARREALVSELELFDPAAYAEANPGLSGKLATMLGGEGEANGMQLAMHYIRWGNAEGRPIDGEGTTLEVGTPAVWEGIQSKGSELRTGERMTKDEMLVSENGRFAAVFDRQGDLTLYDMTGATPAPIWAADNRGERTDDGWLEMQADGNLVIRDDDGEPGFRSDTHAEGGVAAGAIVLRLEDDGRLVIHDRVKGDALWVGGAGESDGEGRGRFVRSADASEAPADAVPTATGSAARNTVMHHDAGALAYLASDPDLVRRFHAEGGGDAVLWAREHYETEGRFGEVVIDFDPQAYLAAPGNDDLVMAFAGDAEAATRHFVEFGLTEFDAGQRADIRLDEGEAPNTASLIRDDVMTTEQGAVLYVASSPDLIEAAGAAGADSVAQIVDWARTHFVAFGWSEDRPIDFDAGAYAAAPENADLLAEYGARDLAGLAAHWIRIGHAEAGRVYRPG